MLIFNAFVLHIRMNGEHIIRQPMADELQQTDLQEDINRQPMAGEMQLAVTHLNFQPSAINNHLFYKRQQCLVC